MARRLLYFERNSSASIQADSTPSSNFCKLYIILPFIILDIAVELNLLLPPGLEKQAANLLLNSSFSVITGDKVTKKAANCQRHYGQIAVCLLLAVSPKATEKSSLLTEKVSEGDGKMSVSHSAIPADGILSKVRIIDL